MNQRRLRVLFLCTHNSARSQMAEGLLRQYAGDQIEVASAGTEPGGVHPLAMKAMQEINIDISAARSKSVDEFLDQQFDYVITLCDQANETCPLFPGDPERIHWSFTDPSAAKGSEEERLHAFEQIRAQLAIRLRTWLQLPLTQRQAPTAPVEDPA
ncbi:MAG: arsenate reductase ArsC [Nitrolancea sp.]